MDLFGFNRLHYGVPKTSSHSRSSSPSSQESASTSSRPIRTSSRSVSSKSDRSGGRSMSSSTNAERKSGGQDWFEASFSTSHKNRKDTRTSTGKSGGQDNHGGRPKSGGREKTVNGLPVRSTGHVLLAARKRPTAVCHIPPPPKKDRTMDKEKQSRPRGSGVENTPSIHSKPYGPGVHTIPSVQSRPRDYGIEKSVHSKSHTQTARVENEIKQDRSRRAGMTSVRVRWENADKLTTIVPPLSTTDTNVYENKTGGVASGPTSTVCQEAHQVVPYPYIMVWNGEIHAVLDREHTIFILVNTTGPNEWTLHSRPLPPSIPANSIIQLTPDQDQDIKVQIQKARDDPKAWPPAWKRLSVNDPEWLRLTQGWHMLTSECVGPICRTRGMIDVVSGKCMVRTTIVERSVPDRYSAFLSHLLPKSNAGAPAAQLPTTVDRVGKSLSHLLIYRSQTGKTPEILLMGVVNACGQVYAFPYDFPVQYAYEFNSRVFGVDPIYLTQLIPIVEEQRRRNCHVLSTSPSDSATPASAPACEKVTTQLKNPTDTDTATTTSTCKDDLKTGSRSVHRLLTDLQEEAGNFIILPTSCLFEFTDSEKPGVFLVRESACYELNSRTPRVSATGQPDDPKSLFRAYLVERDPTSSAHAIVLAGFNDEMKLIVPEQRIRIEITDMARISTLPVDFSRQISPQIHQELDRSSSLALTDFLSRLHGQPFQVVRSS